MRDVGLLVLGGALTALAALVIQRNAPGLWARLTKRPPLVVHVETDPALMCAGYPPWIGSAFVLPNESDPASLGTPPTNCRDWRQWLWSKGAYDGRTTDMRVTVVGNAEATVVVDGLRVTEIERSSATGIMIQCPVGGASAPPRAVEVDLDWAPGVVRYLAAGDHSAHAPFVFQLTKGAVEVFHIQARATSTACRWKAELLLLVDGKRDTIVIHDNGEPFRTSTSSGLPEYLWGASGWQKM